MRFRRDTIRVHRPRLMPAGLAVALVLACSEPPAPGAGGAGAGADGPPERIVLIVADTLRRDFLSPYGWKPQTPNLQRLADEGVAFENAIASFHQTTMSMSSLFTGRTPSIESGDTATPLPWTSRNWCGLSRLAVSEADTCIPDHLDTLAEELAAQDYETLGIVSNRLIFRPYGYDQGFDTWIEVGEPDRPENQTDRIEESKLRTGERVNQQVFAALAARQSDRFLLYVHYIDPHDYGIRPDLDTYADGVRYTDSAVGALLDHLRKNGWLEDAVVLFTSDHGEYLGSKHPIRATKKHFGNPSYDSLLKIPLIVSPAPERDPNALIRTQDLRGLVGEIAGLGPASTSDIEPGEVFLTEMHYQTYRKGRWKSTWSRDRKQTALFDLDLDPGETRNVAGKHPGVIALHRMRIAKLAEAMSTEQGKDAELSDDDEERLRALGYLE